MRQAVQDEPELAEDAVRVADLVVLASGRRVVVGPFREEGLEIANVSDRWTPPGIGLCASFTPRKK
ncbi:MAG: hypothetical protein JWO38_1305 [Gemmataceae bacterium]|nr:hypothetical protein [Gemmataceae bacterium]